MGASEVTGFHVPEFGYRRKKTILKVILPSSVGLGMVALTVPVYVWDTKKGSQVKRQGKAYTEASVLGNGVQSGEEHYTNERQNEDAEVYWKKDEK